MLEACDFKSCEVHSNKSNNISFSIKEDYSKANSIEIELPELEFIER